MSMIVPPGTSKEFPLYGCGQARAVGYSNANAVPSWTQPGSVVWPTGGRL